MSDDALPPGGSPPGPSRRAGSPPPPIPPPTVPLPTVPPPSAHEALYGALVRDLARRRGVVVVSKRDSRLCRLLDRALRLVTLGGQDRFLSDYVTTLGRRVYVPDGWDGVPAGHRYTVLRHEAVHVEQFRRWTWPGMVLLYVLLPLPMGFAAGRAWLEWQGYRETLTATWQLYGPEAARSQALRDDIVARFTGPDYGWMWARGTMIEAAIVRHLGRLAANPPAPLKVPAL